MKRIFHHYSKWEDWKDGLYRESVDEATTVGRAKRLLADTDALLYAMTQVIDQYVCSAEQNLSNRSRNRQAWLGQSACCFVCGAPEHLTKAAWHELSPAEQDRANAVADKVIAIWESRRCQNAA